MQYTKSGALFIFLFLFAQVFTAPTDSTLSPVVSSTGPSSVKKGSYKLKCVSNSDCPNNLACITQKCKDPCPGTCGVNAECRVNNHIPACTCPSAYTGDPFVQCSIQPRPVNPGESSPCGPNSKFVEINDQAVCSCLPDYFGLPPDCRPECVASSECPDTKACVNQKCIDPCSGTCGVNAECHVIRHNPVCSCPYAYIGNPFVQCSIQPRPVNPCEPSPCGPNSKCVKINDQAVCSCLPDYFGLPPDCIPECIASSECPHTKACVNQKCIDPCSGTCGVNAECHVIGHSPICSCPSAYTGDPVLECSIQSIEPAEPVHLCVSSPCGPNSECREVNDQAVCSCLPNSVGTPPNCRPE